MNKRTYAIRKEDKASNVIGYVFDAGIDAPFDVLIGVDNRYKGRWYLTDLNTGLSLGGWFPTRKAAIEAYETRYKDALAKMVRKSLLDSREYYSRMVKEFDNILEVRK